MSMQVVSKLKPFFVSSLFIVLTGCAGFSFDEQAAEDPIKKEQLVWPQPPDTPRYRFETVIRTPADIGAGNLGIMGSLTGANNETARSPAFVKPSAIQVRQGRIYVVDSAAKTVTVLDIPRAKVYRMGQRMPGQLARPAAVALDKEGLVYVADSKQQIVNVYDSLGLYIRSIGGPNDFSRPTGVAVSPDGNRVYVVDRADNESNKHQMVIFDRAGNKLKVVGTRGDGNGQFNVPLQAAVAEDGSVYVLDSGNFRVQIFDREGNFLRTFGRLGKQLGSFARPRGIALDKAGNIYVSDATLNNTQIFNNQGQLLMSIGATSGKDLPGKFSLVNGVAVDETGRIYMVDQSFNKIEVFKPIGKQDSSQSKKR